MTLLNVQQAVEAYCETWIKGRGYWRKVGMQQDPSNGGQNSLLLLQKSDAGGITRMWLFRGMNYVTKLEGAGKQEIADVAVRGLVARSANKLVSWIEI